MASPLQNSIDFLRDFGLFDIVLPFLLVFALVFAILEKTLVLGSEGGDGKTPKKNLNSMIAFVVALLVVATNKIVTTINEALPNIVLLLVVLISFLILIGVFMKTGEMDFSDKHKGWYATFVGLVFVAVILIFLGSLQLSSGESWLEYAWNYTMDNWGGSIFGSFVFFLVMIVGIIIITKGNKKQESG